MLIIFGVKRRRNQLGVAFLMCARCQRPCAHAVVQIRTWFSLFFIPVIPLGSKYFTSCSLCGVATRIDAAQAEHLQQVAAQQASQPVQMTPDGPITPLGQAPAGLPPAVTDRAAPAYPPSPPPPPPPGQPATPT